MKKILVTGGAGYIGSHTCLKLLDAGHEVIIIDDLSTGHLHTVKNVLKTEFVIGSIGDNDLLGKIFTQNKIEAVMHFSAHAYVGESMQYPEKYYRNNVSETLNLLKCMKLHGINAFIFSSSCATYGLANKIPISEDHPQLPINPYGWSKLMVEQILRDFDHAYGLKSIVLRYFNAAGADPLGRLGEDHNPETHLIPLVLSAGRNSSDFITVHGNDYETTDGTCVRDYIHVDDLANAHILALEYLFLSGKSNAFNLGNSKGFSVREVIDYAQEIMGKRINVKICGRRPGDAPVLIGDSTKIRKVLRWSPKYPKLEDIINHAWIWMSKKESIING